MKKFQTIIQSVILGLILAIGGTYAVAWTGPTATPPGNNVEAPINTSNVLQTKTGALHVGSAITLPGGVSFRTLAGQSAFGTSSPIAANLRTLFSGNVGAAKYCNEAGTICKSMEEILTLISNIENNNYFGQLPAPAFDTGWQSYTNGVTTNVVHNLGTENYIVYVEARSTGAPGINGTYSTGELDGAGAGLGFYWEQKTANSIGIRRQSNGSGHANIRVRLWTYPDAGAPTVSLTAECYNNCDAYGGDTAFSHQENGREVLHISNDLSNASVRFSWGINGFPAGSSCIRTYSSTPNGKVPASGGGGASGTGWNGGTTTSSQNQTGAVTIRSTTDTTPYGGYAIYTFKLSCSGGLVKEVDVKNYY